MDDLEAKLKDSAGARHRLIATDGVFSMDGYIAKLKEICDLADKYDALVMVDDSHAVGFIGEHGRGTPDTAASKAASTSSPAPSAKLSAAPAEATPAAARRSSSFCASAPALIFSQTPSRRQSSPHRSKSSIWSANPPTCANASATTRNTSAKP